MPTLMQARHLAKAYGATKAVRDVSLTIAKGELTAVIGPNGAGKSTTIAMLIGTEKPDGGTIAYPEGGHGHGHERDTDTASAMHAQRPTIGVVFQNSVLDAQLTVRENLANRALLYRDLPKSRVDEVIDLTGIGAFSNQRYGTLSGGQQRKTDIARALLNNPDILVLDEPTTGLDITTRTALWTLIGTLRRQNHLSVLLTTHYLEEAEHAERVYIVDRGTVKAQGSAEQLINRYARYQLNLTLRDNGDAGQPQAADCAIDQALERIRTATPPQADDARHRTLTLACADECLTVLAAVRPYIADFACRPGTMDDVFLTLTADGAHPSSFPNE